MTRKVIYQEDLAYIHHVGFGAFATRSAPELLRILQRAGIRHGTLVDLGCGSGLWARAALRVGFNVIGVDQSSAMIQIARRLAPAARFRCASLHEFDLPTCDVVTAIGESLNYLPATKQPVPRLRQLLRRIAKALRPGGVFIFDVLVHGGEPLHGRNWRHGKDWAVLTAVEEKPTQHLLKRTIITFRKIRSTWRRAEETHRIRLFEPAEISGALHQAGFSIRFARRYGKVALLPRRLAFIARKRS